MMKISTLCFVLLIAAGWATAQKAQPTKVQTTIPSLDEQGRKGDIARLAQKQAAEKFDEADKDKDGKISREEAETFPYVLKKFDSMDTSKDGFLNWEEFVGHSLWKKEAN
jgi:Ca2+-binding EF-hand superfamily protein